jgi:PleD family two-component response regulator
MDETQDEAKGLELGAIDYIMKPVSPAIVRVRVRNHIESKRNRDALAKLAQIDGVTGIHNRRLFDEHLQIEWRRAKRSHTEMCLILIDADHFKQHNDTYGHIEGDACLKEVANVLQSSIERAGDFVARYGAKSLCACFQILIKLVQSKLQRSYVELLRIWRYPIAVHPPVTMLRSVWAWLYVHLRPTQ